jgi:Fe-S cluster biogenesis protein NfuA
MMEKRIEKCLESIRPYLREDGGDVLFKRLREDGVLELEWVGACRTCPMSQLTLRAGVERALLHEIPEIKRVEAVSS